MQSLTWDPTRLIISLIKLLSNHFRRRENIALGAPSPTLIAGGGEGGAEEESRVPRPEDHRLREPDPDLLDARQDLPLLRHLQGRRPRRQGRRRGELKKGRMKVQHQMSALEMEWCNFRAGSDE